MSRYGFEILSNPDSLQGLSADVREACIEAHLTPTPRLHESRFISASGAATAMIDISDGFASDLRHLCRASGVGAHIELMPLLTPTLIGVIGDTAGSHEPEWVLEGGEDYELLFTIKPEAEAEFCDEMERITGCPVTEIGTIREASYGIRAVDSAGHKFGLNPRGWDHFRG